LYKASGASVRRAARSGMQLLQPDAGLTKRLLQQKNQRLHLALEIFLYRYRLDRDDRTNFYREKLHRAHHWLTPGYWNTARGICGILIALLFCSIPSQAQLSPGPLSRAHHDLGGPIGCTQCHAVSAGSPGFRCLDCHRDIASRIQQHKGFHSTLLQPGGSGAACIKCHSEHNGENFSLLHWDPSPKGFDHAKKTGMPLDGKHAQAACRDCHNAKNISATERASLSAKDMSHTYLGLSRACVSCHEDKHQGRLGTNCVQCHSPASWKSVQSFDHTKARYPLTGAHLQVACQTCHTPGPDGAARYTGLKFEHCTSCHTDPHHGAFKQGCESCHTTRGWSKTAAAVEFDHSKTKYPLLGKHAQVACGSCHRGGDFKKVIAFQNCADCHKPDPHKGQFAKRPDGGRCENCHTVQGFKTATFSVEDHLRTGFPLRGKHAAVGCASCHIPAGRNTLFKMKFALCVDCHKDVHRGQFSSAPYLNQCEQCHSEKTFRPSTMTIVRHQNTHFALTGSHLAVACIDCHKPLAKDQTATYHFSALSCATCHADPHHNQFAERMSKIGVSGKAVGCEACHSTKQWSDLGGFNHESTRFALTGAHRAVTCADCHRPPNLETTLLHVSFRAASSNCQDCHENPHGNQFARESVTRCAECHTTTKWRPSTVDHDKTAFSLKGAHQNVRCDACHTNIQQLNGKPVLVYKSTPTACSSCHGSIISYPSAQSPVKSQSVLSWKE